LKQTEDFLENFFLGVFFAEEDDWRFKKKMDLIEFEFFNIFDGDEGAN